MGEKVNQKKGIAPPLYKPGLPVTWWLRNWHYFFFMLREVSSLFVAVLAVTYLVGIYRLTEGRDSYNAYLDALQTPFWKVLSVVILLFSLYHTVTWFQSAGKVMVLRIGRHPISPTLLFIGNCAGWGVVSAAVFYLMVGF